MQPKKKAIGPLAGLGGRVTRARHRLNLTQEALAAQANLSMSTLSKIETGTSTPTLDVLIRLAVVLAISPDQLLGWSKIDLSPDAQKKAQAIDELMTALDQLPASHLDAILTLIRK